MTMSHIPTPGLAKILASKPTKGVFKSSGQKLTEEEQDDKLAVLNPIKRPAIPGMCRVPAKIHSYINAA
jgi:hypothetical protein